MMVELEILSKKENLLLNRIEARFSVPHAGSATPKKKDVVHVLSEEFSTKPELVVVDDYCTRAAGMKASGVARIYNDKQSLEKAEIIKRVGGGGSKKKEAKSGAPPAETAAPKK